MGNTPQYVNFYQNEKRQSQTETTSMQPYYEEEYEKTYEKIKCLPYFLDKYLHQCPHFGKYLPSLFPNSLSDPQQYFEMISYLTTYEPKINSSQKAQENIKDSTLLDRFFMICLGNLSLDQYSITKLTALNLQELLLDYFRLFVQNPRSGRINKILKFIGMGEEYNPEQLISVKLFAQKLREYFPHVQKYLNDYYLAKFRDGKETFRILSHFRSQIVLEDAVILALKMPDLARPQTQQLYNSEQYGTGFYTLEKRILGYTGPWLMLIQHSQKGLQGNRQTYVFGTYQNGPIRDVGGFQGDLTGYLFTLDPNLNFMTTDKGYGQQRYFIISSGDQRITKQKKGIGFGGNQEMKNFKLWIDENLDNSTVYNCFDPTYGAGFLTGIGTEKLNIQRIEIWGLGTSQDLKNQEDYWKERYAEIEKVRKVNKKEFLEQSGVYLENVFVHRDQVLGQIQKPERRESSNTMTTKGKQNLAP